MSDTGLDEWKEITISPKGLLSGFVTDHSVSKSFANNFSVGEGILGIHGGTDHEVEVENSTFGSEKVKAETMEGRDSGLNCSGNSGVSIAERRAAKCGFNGINAAEISTPRFRTSSPLPSPTARSPYLTIPAGIYPHELLDSPILLHNSQLSPTTGKFATPLLDGDGQIISASPADADNSCDGGSSSMFKPYTDNSSFACFHDVKTQGLATHVGCRSVTYLHPPMDCEVPVRFSTEVGTNNHDAPSPPDRKILGDVTINSNSCTVQPSNSSVVACVQMPDKNEPSIGDDSATCNSLDGDLKGTYLSTGAVRTADDGYNWRKYGQKQVKGSEYPRSYYKCTHPNCQVKKIVERSHDGQITEITYKGAHNHPEPQPCRKSALGPLPSNETSDLGDCTGPCVNAEGASVWRNIQADVKIGSDWRIDGLDRTSSASVLTDVSDLLSTTQVKPMGVLESGGTEFSSTMASHEGDEEDATAEGNYLLGGDHENELESKRRKKGACLTETTLGSRAVRESRVVVELESEVDILNDGYRWRKYGQKVVKGNPNPRSYYKCTSAGCNVRKHVERASQNLKNVIVTYEGKHNHEVPAARNSSHTNTGSGSLPPATSTQTNMTLPRNPHLPKTEPHSQDLPPRFDAKIGCSDGILRQNILDAGTPPFYHQMKFSTLPNTTPYGPFGLTNHHPAYTSGIVPAVPDISIPLPMAFPHSIPNYGNPEGPLSSVQSLYAGQQLKDCDLKFVRPKQEQRDDLFYGTDMHNIDHPNSSTSVYDHIMQTFPS